MLGNLTDKEKRKKYISDFGHPPFFIDTKKWLEANFDGDVYKGRLK